MPNSQRSSRASATSRPPAEAPVARLEWRPSRWLAAALLALGLLAAVAVLASEMPRGAAWLLVSASLLHAARSAARYRRLASVAVLCDGRAGTVVVDGVPATQAAWHWRGPFAFLRWRGRGGRKRTLAFWPDVLDTPQRRELRLAAGPAAASRPRPSVAP